jgi:DNA-binding transcriptional LysR family regulator
VAIVTNTSTAHYWAVAKGAGIGMLPTYLWAIGARVEPVEIGLDTQYDIWMVYHPDSRKIGRIGATIDWLKTLFDPKTFPWFRDEFIPPERLTGASMDTARPNLFDGFAGR